MAFRRGVFDPQEWHGRLSRLRRLLVVLISSTFLILPIHPTHIGHARDMVPVQPLVNLGNTLSIGFSGVRGTDGDRSLERLTYGVADAKWMEVLFGEEKGGGLGNIRKIQSITGEVTLCADITHDKNPNSITALIQKLLGWIEANTDYDVSVSRKEPPTLHFCRSGDSIFYEDHRLVIDKGLAAVYDIKSRTIYIAEPWSPEDPHDVSRLLHELIHDVQTRNKRWPCWGDAEWTTYKLQEKWLLAHGIKPGFNWVQVFLLTLCRHNIHS